jgi:hypothetical protein
MSCVLVCSRSCVLSYLFLARIEEERRNVWKRTQPLIATILATTISTQEEKFDVEISRQKQS